MSICDRRHVNMSKQTTTLADIYVTPPLGLSYGHVIWFVSRVIRVAIGRAKHFREFIAFRHEKSSQFCGDADNVEMSCTGRKIGSVVLALRC